MQKFLIKLSKHSFFTLAFLPLIFLPILCFAEKSAIDDVQSPQFNSETIYIIDEVLAKATAKTAVAAQNSAMNKARRKAFSTLLYRLGLDPAVADQASNQEISDMIRSERILNERIAGASYSAKVNFIFAPDFVEYFLKKFPNKASEGVPLAKDPNASAIQENIGNSAILIPAQFSEEGLAIWESRNTWRDFLELIIQNNKNSKFILPKGGINEISSINQQNLGNLRYEEIKNLLAEYRADLAYIVVFNYNPNLKKAVVEVALISKMQHKNFRLAYYNNKDLGIDNIKKVMAEKTIAYLAGKLVAAQAAFDKSVTKIEIAIQNIDDLNRVKNLIETSNLAQNMEILSIAKDSVLISLNYIGVQDMISAFYEKGLKISTDQEGRYFASLQ